MGLDGTMVIFKIILLVLDGTIGYLSQTEFSDSYLIIKSQKLTLRQKS